MSGTLPQSPVLRAFQYSPLNLQRIYLETNPLPHGAQCTIGITDSCETLMSHMSVACPCYMCEISTTCLSTTDMFCREVLVHGVSLMPTKRR